VKRSFVSLGLAVPRAVLEGATSLGLEDAEPAADAAVCLDLSLFISGQRAFARLGGERVHAVFIGRAETERQYALGCRRGLRRFVWSCNPSQDGRLMVGWHALTHTQSFERSTLSQLSLS
jgi:hypothetical protein